MKQLFTFMFVLFAGLMISNQALAVERPSAPSQNSSDSEQLIIKPAVEKTTANPGIFSKWKKRLAKATDQVLLVILAIFLPPIAVLLLEGVTTNFWIDLVLTLLGWIPGMIFALYLVLV